MGSRNSPRIPVHGKWSLNVAYMLANPECQVWLGCSACGTNRPLTPEILAKLVREKNPLYCLYNRHPKCPKCQRPMSYRGCSGPASPVVPLIDTDAPWQIDKLHAAWKREEERIRGNG